MNATKIKSNISNLYFFIDNLYLISTNVIRGMVKK